MRNQWNVTAFGKSLLLAVLIVISSGVSDSSAQNNRSSCPNGTVQLQSGQFSTCAAIGSTLCSGISSRLPSVCRPGQRCQSSGTFATCAEIGATLCNSTMGSGAPNVCAPHQQCLSTTQFSMCAARGSILCGPSGRTTCPPNTKCGNDPRQPCLPR
jgi:hypothetical protein